MIKILLIEDDAVDAELTRRMLSRGAVQFAVHHVSLLSEALALLHDVGFDAVLSDLRLPDSAGLETFHKLQATGTTIPILVLSGLGDEEIAVEAMQAGAQDYLVKGQSNASTMIRAIRYAIERKKGEQQLAYLALHDPLTGLGNRTLFHDHLEQGLDHARRANDGTAVMFIDLDNFKTINDTLGHDVGDQVLVSVAERLRTCVRQADTVARLGGDEFAAVLVDLPHPESALVVARKVLEAIREPIGLGAHTLRVTPSIGLAVYPDCGEDAETLVKNADAAMYEAKQEGRNALRFYTADMSHETRRRIAVESALQEALETQELSLSYQPRFDIASGRIVGAEALVRWSSSELGPVSPDEFIPLAAETDGIVSIGAWAILAACTQGKAWHESTHRPLRISVNVSVRQIMRPGLETIVSEALEASGLAPQHLELEITEEALSLSASQLSVLEQIRAMGVSVCVDDFGTGLTSMGRLKRAPIDRLKIHESFVQNVTTDIDDAATTAAIIAFAHSLGLPVVAEGVETAAQAEFIRDHGGDEVQGHLYSHALPPAAFEAFLEAHE